MTDKQAGRYLLKLLDYFSQPVRGDLADYRTAARLAQALLANYPELADQDIASQLRDDFKSVERSATLPTSSMSKSGLIFTAFASDPKFLLTIGDLVDTSTCQNYRTGTVIQTLLGYVIDANVKAVASFHLTSANFKTVKDYEEVFQAQRSGLAPGLSWNGNKRVVYFTMADGRQIETQPLGHAFLRQMVKVGSVEAENDDVAPALFMEREYLQIHPALERMRQNHRAIYDAVSRDIGAVNEGTVTISASRNPGGHYSDAASGEMTDSYEVCL